LRQHFPEAHYISVHSGEGLEGLIEHMGEFVSGDPERMELHFPHSAAEAVARLHGETRVLESDYTPHGVRVVAMMSAKLANRYKDYIKPASGKKTARRRHSLQTN
jgi:GTP-binding protein HflX